MGQSKYYPTYDELSNSDRTILKEITMDSELFVIFDEDGYYSEWTDDNALCFNVSLNDVRVSFWWINGEYFAATLYAAELESARKKLLTLINDENNLFEENLRTKES